MDNHVQRHQLMRRGHGAELFQRPIDELLRMP